MAWFRVEVMNEKGKVIELLHVDLPATSVMQALNTSKVKKIKKEARFQGMGFRVKLEEGQK